MRCISPIWPPRPVRYDPGQLDHAHRTQPTDDAHRPRVSRLQPELLVKASTHTGWPVGSVNGSRARHTATGAPTRSEPGDARARSDRRDSTAQGLTPLRPWTPAPTPRGVRRGGRGAGSDLREQVLDICRGQPSDFMQGHNVLNDQVRLDAWLVNVTTRVVVKAVQPAEPSDDTLSRCRPLTSSTPREVRSPGYRPKQGITLTHTIRKRWLYGDTVGVTPAGLRRVRGCCPFDVLHPRRSACDLERTHPDRRSPLAPLTVRVVALGVVDQRYDRCCSHHHAH
jgi:hypothetical protein